MAVTPAPPETPLGLSAFTPTEIGTLRDLIDTIIPADDWPGGWEGGVRKLFEQQLPGFLADEVAGIRELITQVNGVSGDFVHLDADVKNRLVADLVAGSDSRMNRLITLAFQGFYAGTSEPAGWAMVGFSPTHPIPDPAPISTVTQRSVRRHYDAVVIGAGAGGGVVASELSKSGLSVLVVERSSAHLNSELQGNHLQGKRQQEYAVIAGPGNGHPRVLEHIDGSTTLLDGAGNGEAYGLVAMTLGGGTRVWQGMAWRFYPEDFMMATTYGVPESSTLADWPITYDELEPYYSRVEWELGVSGDAQSAVGRAVPRSLPYPMPPLRDTQSRQLMGAAASRLGWQTSPIPFAINSVPRAGRQACVACAQCVGHACPVDAKNGTQNTFLPRAVATGLCDVLLSTQVTRINVDASGHATSLRAVTVTGGETLELQLSADRVVVCAGAVESARLLLASGIGNDWVGRNHLTHGLAFATALDGPIYKGYEGPGHSVATVDFVHNQKRAWGGGVIFDLPPQYPLAKAQVGRVEAPAPFGAPHKSWMRHSNTSIGAMSMVQEIPHEQTRITLDSRATDRYGMPAARLRGRTHAATAEAAAFMADRCGDWIRELGASGIRTFTVDGAPQGAEHSAGTVRMSAEESTGACGPDGRVWGTRNVYVADASTHPTNGGFNPGLTVLANAMRIANLITTS